MQCEWCGREGASRTEPFCSAECEALYEDWEYNQ